MQNPHINKHQFRLDCIPTLKIGNLEIYPPIIQGGMGVRVSMANLASAVADTGCAGTIASVGLGLFENFPGSEFEKINQEAFRNEIRKARRQSSGIIGVNIMVALTDYENLVKIAVQEAVDFIVCGAGLPLSLPEFIQGKDIKLIPVVSSARTLQILCKRWENRYHRLPDAVIVEGPMAGGHLGYSYESVIRNSSASLEQIVQEVLSISESFSPPIPVIAAGGIFDGADIARFLKLGASGVQMATRFVCTHECDVHDNFKQAYLKASADDITVIQSPVGLPGRVIRNDFVEQIKKGQTLPVICNYRCLKTCEPQKTPYCIARVLSEAAAGKLDKAFVFAGSNACRCNKIISVKELVETLTAELTHALSIEKKLPV